MPIIDNKLLNQTLVILNKKNIDINANLFNTIQKSPECQKSIITINQIENETTIYNSLIENNQLQKAIGVFYDAKIQLNAENLNKILNNSDLQIALGAAYNYLNENQFGLFFQHGHRGRNDTLIFINNLLELNNPSRDMIQTELTRWRCGYGFLRCLFSSGNNPHSRANIAQNTFATSEQDIPTPFHRGPNSVIPSRSRELPNS